MSKAEPGRDRVCAVGAESTRCAFREWRMPLDLLLTFTRNLRFSGDSRRLPPLYTLNLKCQSCRPSLAKLGQQRRHLPRLSGETPDRNPPKLRRQRRHLPRLSGETPDRNLPSVARTRPSRDPHMQQPAALHSRPSVTLFTTPRGPWIRLPGYPGPPETQTSTCKRTNKQTSNSHERKFFEPRRLGR